MSFDIEIEIAPGEDIIACRIVSDATVTALVGPSGAGKTSVLNAVSGLLKPRSGHVRIADELLFDAASDTDLAPERRRAGYVFQDMRLFPHRSVAANLAYAEGFVSPDEHWIARDEVVDLLDIADLLDRAPSTLSGGEARRVAIGRALLSAPRFLLLDEPFAGLDRERAKAFTELVERIGGELQLPILLVSHSASDVERLAGHVAEMRPRPSKRIRSA